MENKEIYEEYKQEHPEELAEVGKVYEFSARIERDREARKEAKLRRVEECRRKLYGQDNTK